MPFVDSRVNESHDKLTLDVNELSILFRCTNPNLKINKARSLQTLSK